METQSTILAWGRATFGESGALEIALRMNVEMAELVNGLSNLYLPDDKDLDQRRAMALATRTEVIDVWIMFAQVSRLMGMHLETPVNEPWKWGQGATVLRLTLVLNRTFAQLYTNLEQDLPLWPALMDVRPILGALFCRLTVEFNLPNPDFQAEVDAKVAILRARKWGRTATGKGQHIDDPEVPRVPSYPKPVLKNRLREMIDRAVSFVKFPGYASGGYVPAGPLVPPLAFVETGSGLLMNTGLWYILADSGSAYTDTGFASPEKAREFIEQNRSMFAAECTDFASSVVRYREADGTWTEEWDLVNIVYGEDLWKFWANNPL